MTWDRLLMMGFAAIFSLAYSVCVFIAGLQTGNGFAWKAALACLGLCYVCYALQAVQPQWDGSAIGWQGMAKAAVALSIIAGLIGGLALLVK